MNTIKKYSTKQGAIKGMWRYYQREIGGSPLVGDNGTTLQWCINGLTRSLSVTHDNNYDNRQWLLQASWIE